MKGYYFVPGVLFLLIITLACEISMVENTTPELNLEATAAAVLGDNSGTPVSGGESNCHIITNIKDVNYPDNTVVAPGENITKTWQVTNGGTCTWTTGYHIVRISLQDSSILAGYGIPETVYPGETVTISVPIQAPEENGTVTYYYMLMDESGNTFGYDTGASKPFWAALQVSGSNHTTAEEQPQPAQAEIQQPQQAPDSSSCIYTASSIKDPMNDFYLDPNEGIDVIWTLTNTGTCTWDANSHVELIKSEMPQSVTYLTTGKTVGPGEKAQFIVPIMAGDQPGSYQQSWKLVTQHGELRNFGNSTDNLGVLFWVRVNQPPEPEYPEIQLKLPSGKLTWVGLQKCGTVPPNPLVNLEAEIKSVNYKGWVHLELRLNGYQKYPLPEKNFGCSIDPSISVQISPGQTKNFQFTINRNKCTEMNNHVIGQIYYLVIIDEYPDLYVEGGEGV